jgi:hypothetical protein
VCTYVAFTTQGRECCLCLPPWALSRAQHLLHTGSQLQRRPGVAQHHSVLYLRCYGLLTASSLGTDPCSGCRYEGGCGSRVRRWTSCNQGINKEGALHRCTFPPFCTFHSYLCGVNPVAGVSEAGVDGDADRWHLEANQHRCDQCCWRSDM